jgi:hypothetical protein
MGHHYFQLRVIRAFRSTLEDMEEKRSVHSIHSLRSTRSILTRPMSDISYIDEETVSGSSANRGPSFNGGSLLAAPPRHGMNSSLRAKSGNDSSAVTNNYLKVEGQAYRVCRSAASVGRHDGIIGHAAGLSARRTSDAQTQSAESSFTLAIEETDQPVVVNNTTAHEQPPQQQTIDAASSFNQQTGSTRNDEFSYPTAYVHVVGVPSSSRGPSPVMLAPAPVHYSVAGGMGATHLLPSPLYSAVNYGYDPTYCQYLGQAADGYQYELVRRPSMGAPPSPIPPPTQPMVQPNPGQHDLLMPTQYNMRGGSSLLVPAPSPVPHYHHHGLTSMQGSFDSVGGPPATPIFMQPASPRPSFHHHPPHSSQQQQQPFQAYSSTPHRLSSSNNPGPGNEWGQSSAADIPKLIHETSI